MNIQGKCLGVALRWTANLRDLSLDVETDTIRGYFRLKFTSRKGFQSALSVFPPQDEDDLNFPLLDMVYTKSQERHWFYHKLQGSHSVECPKAQSCISTATIFRDVWYEDDQRNTIGDGCFMLVDPDPNSKSLGVFQCVLFLFENVNGEGFDHVIGAETQGYRVDDRRLQVDHYGHLYHLVFQSSGDLEECLCGLRVRQSLVHYGLAVLDLQGQMQVATVESEKVKAVIRQMTVAARLWRLCCWLIGLILLLVGQTYLECQNLWTAWELTVFRLGHTLILGSLRIQSALCANS